MTAGLGEGAARFARRVPVVWHVAEAENAAGILARGLRPAAQLLDAGGRPGTHRDDFVRTAGPHGAILRFQQMPDAVLAASLRGAFAGAPDRWRALIDSQVYFWADPRRRDAFLQATRRERGRSQALPGTAAPDVLAFDTALLLGACGGAAYFSTFNTGSVVRGGLRARRDEHSFQPVGSYRSGPVAELAVRDAVPAAVLAAARLP